MKYLTKLKDLKLLKWVLCVIFWVNINLFFSLYLVGCGTAKDRPDIYLKADCKYRLKKLFSNPKKNLAQKQKEYIQLARQCRIKTAFNFPTGLYVVWQDGTISGEWCDWCIWEKDDDPNDIREKTDQAINFFKQK
jgi:hypothetical protein